jgi:hypothetical protein
MIANIKRSKEIIPREAPYGRERTVATAVRRTPLNKTLVYPFCTITKVKIAVWSAPARN